VETKASAEASIPTHAKEVDRVRLRGVGGDVEGDALVLTDAGRRGVALDLPGRVVGNERPELPGGVAGLLVLGDDRIAGRSRRSHQARHGSAEQRQDEQGGDQKRSEAHSDRGNPGRMHANHSD